MIFARHQLELASYTCVLPCPETPSCLPLHPTPLGCPSTVFGWPACHIEFAPVIYFTYGLKRPWFWERLRAAEGDDRGWDGWMASLTWWTWVWASSGSWWWTGRPGVLQSMGSPRVRHDWATGQQQQSLPRDSHRTECVGSGFHSKVYWSYRELIMHLGRGWRQHFKPLS